MKNNIYIGFDIGGANTKVTVFDNNFIIINVIFKNIKIWDNLNEISNFFSLISSQYKLFNVSNYITITAESCDNFINRDKGIISVIEICNTTLFGKIFFYSNLDEYIEYNAAITCPKNLFSTNWLLTKKLVDLDNNIDLLIDIGSTTTDFIYNDIDIKFNLTDYDRLKNYNLLYLGVIRTPIPMVVDYVMYKGSKLPLVRELFATTGDVFNITQDINFSTLDYIGADNRDYSNKNSLIRIARTIGLDFKDKDKDEIENTVFYIKNLLIEKIYKNVNLIFKNTKKLNISSVGEGKFLIEDMCRLHKINYINISKNKYFNIPDTIDENLIYCNLPSALVVTNFFNKK
jgi:probable H4MPT-linked C1 transfer pathway protein